jgi:hypothetical protein
MLRVNPFVEAYFYVDDQTILIYVDNTQVGLFNYYDVVNDGKDMRTALMQKYNTNKVMIYTIDRLENPFQKQNKEVINA